MNDLLVYVLVVPALALVAIPVCTIWPGGYWEPRLGEAVYVRHSRWRGLLGGLQIWVAITVLWFCAASLGLQGEMLPP